MFLLHDFQQEGEKVLLSQEASLHEIRYDDRTTWQNINRDLIDTGANGTSVTSQHDS